MATYLLGSSGECADCSADDPCGSVCTSISEIIGTASDAQVVSSKKLMDTDDGAGYNIVIAAVKGTGFEGFYAIKVCDTAFTLGPVFSTTVTASFVTTGLMKTSDTTFADLQSGGFILYSVDVDTLVITATSSTLSYPSGFAVTTSAYVTDGHLIMGTVDSTPFPNVLYYHDADVSSGTSVSYSTPITKSGTGVILLVALESAGDNQCISYEFIGQGSIFNCEMQGITTASGLSFGAVDVFDTHTNSSSKQPLRGGSQHDSIGSKAVFLATNAGGSGRNVYGASYVNGGTATTTPSTDFPTVIRLNSGTVGISAVNTASDKHILPFTLSGDNVTLGSKIPLSNSLTHWVETAREGSGLHFHWSTTDALTVEILT